MRNSCTRCLHGYKKRIILGVLFVRYDHYTTAVLKKPCIYYFTEKGADESAPESVKNLLSVILSASDYAVDENLKGLDPQRFACAQYGYQALCAFRMTLDTFSTT